MLMKLARDARNMFRLIDCFVLVTLGLPTRRVQFFHFHFHFLGLCAIFALCKWLLR